MRLGKRQLGHIMKKTISDNYLSMQKDMHKNPNYGVASLSFGSLVAELISKSNARSVSDYGAGKKNLYVALQANGVSFDNYYPYDPAFPEYGPPRIADLVCCIDVLEHIEAEYLGHVLSDLAEITRNLGFFSVHMGPASKVLPDGRNAHLIQKPISWWIPIISEHFEIIQLQKHNLMGEGFWIVVTPKNAL
jgi:hypothetical protein